VARINVHRSVKAVVERSFILEQLVEDQKIGIIGATHNLDNTADVQRLRS
jgi:carbonic anhydrase